MGKDQVSKKSSFCNGGCCSRFGIFILYKEINSPRNIVIIYMAIFGIGIIVLLCGNNEKMFPR